MHRLATVHARDNQPTNDQRRHDTAIFKSLFHHTMVDKNEKYFSTCRTSSDFESYCFTSAAPTIWNSLSVTTRTANSIGTFRFRLKTDLFEKAYAA